MSPLINPIRSSALLDWILLFFTDLLAVEELRWTSDGIQGQQDTRAQHARTPFWVHFLATSEGHWSVPLGLSSALVAFKLPTNWLFFCRVGQLDLVDGSAWSLIELAKCSAWSQAPILSDPHSQGAVTSLGYCQIFEWKPPALDSIPGFHAGNCWWLSLRFSICLGSFPRFHTGHCWWQLQVSIVLGTGLQFPPVRVRCAILSPSLRFRRNWWWWVQGLLWIRTLNRLLSSFV